MSEEVKNIRLSKAAREFNVGTSTIVEFLAKKGMSIDPSPNTKLTEEQYALVVKEYQGEKEVKKNADQLGNIAFKGKTITVESTEKPKVVEEEEEIVSIKSNILVNDKKDKEDKDEKKEKIEIKEKKEEKVEVKKEEKQEEKVEAIKLNVVGKIDLDGGKKAKEQKGDGQPGNTGKKEEKPQPKPAQPAKPVETPKPAQPKPQPKPVQPQPQKPAEPEQQPAKPELSAEDNFIPTKFTKLEGPRIVDKIELPVEHKGKGKPVATSGEDKKDKKKKNPKWTEDMWADYRGASSEMQALMREEWGDPT